MACALYVGRDPNPNPNLQVGRDPNPNPNLQVGREDLERDVVVVELVVAERDVDVEGEVLAVLEQQPLVDVRRLLEVVAKVVDGGEAQLVRRGVA